MEIGNLHIEVIKKDIKNIHLAVYPPNGTVRLTSPRNVTDDSIRLYAISKLSWIKQQQRSFKRQERRSERHYIQRESHYLFGKRYLLRLSNSLRTTSVAVKNKTYLELNIRSGSSKMQKEKAIEEFYRKELKQRIPALIEKWELKTGIYVQSWGVKKMSTKWGTCNKEAKRIWLNLELAKKPIECLEYIILHEMIHIVERHHNDHFTSLMNQHMPRWKHHKNELNNLPISHVEWGHC